MDPSPPQNQDSLTLSHLHLPTGLTAPYCFPSSSKQQPATVSLTLDLDRGFASAAQHDKLDESTVHYGNLAKAVRQWPVQGGVRECVDFVEGAVEKLARRGDGTRRVRRARVEVELPKASARGERCVVSCVREGEAGRRVSWRVEGVRVMVMIGVNAVERTARQVLEMDLEVFGKGDGVLGREEAVLGLEGRLVEVCGLPHSFAGCSKYVLYLLLGLTGTMNRSSSPPPSKHLSRSPSTWSSACGPRFWRRCLSARACGWRYESPRPWRSQRRPL